MSGGHSAAGTHADENDNGEIDLVAGAAPAAAPGVVPGPQDGDGSDADDVGELLVRQLGEKARPATSECKRADRKRGSDHGASICRAAARYKRMMLF